MFVNVQLNAASVLGVCDCPDECSVGFGCL